MPANITPIFLFSPARSGSTLSQRIMASHPAIATAAEPFFLLPLLSCLKTSGNRLEEDIYAVYNHAHMRRAMQQFCKLFPDGEAEYLDEVRSLATRLYRKAADPPAQYFLDKTPAYHMFVEEIIDLFPDARILFLWRNPLSIVASHLAFGGGLWNLYWAERNLYRALKDLARAYRNHRGRACVLHYEDLLNHPVETWEKVFRYLDLEFDPAQLRDFSTVDLPGPAGDPNRLLPQFQALNPASLEKWRGMFTNPLRKAWIRRYLRWLGSEDLELMGYDLEQLLAAVDSIPTTGKFLRTDLVRMPYGFLYRIFEFRILRHKFNALRAGERVYVHTGVLDWP
jgi:hypothetical protein